MLHLIKCESRPNGFVGGTYSFDETGIDYCKHMFDLFEICGPAEVAFEKKNGGIDPNTFLASEFGDMISAAARADANIAFCDFTILHLGKKARVSVFFRLCILDITASDAYVVNSIGNCLKKAGAK